MVGSKMTDRRLIYIVDDEADLCRSLAMLLQAEGYDARTFSGAIQLLAVLDRLPPGIILTDVQMPEMDGITLISAIRAAGRRDPLIVITGHGNVALAVEALKMGAVDFVEKPFSTETIVTAIEGSVDREAEESDELISRLTKREFDVFTALVEGGTNKRIASQLGISPRTVEVYRANLMSKLEVDGLSQLVRLGISAGVISS